MGLPDKVTAAQTLQNNRRYHEQPGGQTFRNGTPLDVPGGYPSGPTPMGDTAKPSSHVDDPEKKEPTGDASSSGVPAAVSPSDAAARSNRQYEKAENYQPVANLAFGGTNVVRPGAEQTIPNLGSNFFPARVAHGMAEPSFTAPTFYVEADTPPSVLAHAPKPYDRAKEAK